MSSEWIAPTATAATGIAGVGFAWLTSRSSAKAQIELVEIQQKHETTSQRRAERRNTYVALLTALDGVDRDLARCGGRISLALADVAEEVAKARPPRLGERENEAGPVDDVDYGDGDSANDPDDALGEGDGKDEMFRRLAEVLAKVPEDEHTARDAAIRELESGFQEFDRPFQELMLCGSPAVVDAAHLLRDDVLESIRDAMYGEWRFPEASQRRALHNAMRSDLGELDQI